MLNKLDKPDKYSKFNKLSSSCWRSQGVTLLESLLVLVIGLTIIALSIQQYTLYRRDANMTQLRSNVDVLFFALQKYFRANCNNAAFKGSAPVIITLQDLLDEGYLTLPDDTLPISPLVKTESGEQGYVLQFNRYLGDNNRTVHLGPTQTTPVGRILTWQAQVAVAMLDEENAPQYQIMLGGQCTSEISGGGVTPCDNNTVGSFVVFSRMPSFLSAAGSANFWLIDPTVRQFKQMYDVSPILLLISSATERNAQFYMCGS